MNALYFLLAAVVVGYAESTTIFWNGTCPLVVNSTCPDSQYVIYTLYTSLNSAGQVIDVSPDNIASTSFNAANPTKIIIHGFTENPSGNVSLIKNAYLTKGAYNVIMVDWSFLAQGPIACYGFAALNIQHVGECTGQLVQLLRQKSATNIHVVGHSLGAQTANWIALNVTPKLPRISGLDPANLLFPLTAPLNAVLDKTDATFVDVYHTNIGVLGKPDFSGHVDFYFNNGILQPGCGTDVDGFCSHFRAVNYFAESITASTKKFYGKTCSSLLLLSVCSTTSPRTILAGEFTLTSTTGMVKVPTNSATLFAMS